MKEGNIIIAADTAGLNMNNANSKISIISIVPINILVLAYIIIDICYRRGGMNPLGRMD